MSRKDFESVHAQAQRIAWRGHSKSLRLQREGELIDWANIVLRNSFCVDTSYVHPSTPERALSPGRFLLANLFHRQPLPLLQSPRRCHPLCCR